MLELALERIADPHYRQLYEDYAQQVAAVEGGEPFDRLVAERALQDGCDRDEAIRILARSERSPQRSPTGRWPPAATPARPRHRSGEVAPFDRLPLKRDLSSSG